MSSARKQECTGTGESAMTIWIFKLLVLNQIDANNALPHIKESRRSIKTVGHIFSTLKQISKVCQLFVNTAEVKQCANKVKVVIVSNKQVDLPVCVHI